jgi:hypothetical protein
MDGSWLPHVNNASGGRQLQEFSGTQRGISPFAQATHVCTLPCEHVQLRQKFRDSASAEITDPIPMQLVWEGEQGQLVRYLAEPDVPYVQFARDQVTAVAYPGATSP